MRHGRLPWFAPEELDDAQREYYDELLSGPRDTSRLLGPGGRLTGAFNSRLLDPKVGTAIQRTGAALRYGSVLTDRERELVICSVAAAERCDYEWYGHAGHARAAGITDAQLSAVMAGEQPDGLSPEEQAAYRLARRLIATADLTDAEFAEAERAVGYTKVFDVLSLVGHYRHTAMALRVWRVPLLPGDEPVRWP